MVPSVESGVKDLFSCLNGVGTAVRLFVGLVVFVAADVSLLDAAIVGVIVGVPLVWLAPFGTFFLSFLRTVAIDAQRMADANSTTNAKHLLFP